MKKETVKSHFETHAESWLADSYVGSTFDYPTALHRTRVVSRILKAHGEGLSIADLGCGGGNLALCLAADGHVVTGIDFSHHMVEIANQRRNTAPKNIRERLAFEVCELQENNLPSASFDSVTSLGVIGYLDNDEILLGEMHRLLKPNGIAAVSCRNRLFNMNSLSSRTRQEIDAGTAGALLDEMETYLHPVSIQATDRFINRLRELPAFLSMLERDGGGNGATQEEAAASGMPSPHVEARQHTPAALTAAAAGFGLEVISTHGIHPHLIDPRLNRLLPPRIFNALASCLEEFESEPASMLWSSVFISVLRKT